MSKYIKEGLNALRETRAGGPLLPVNTQMARRGVKDVYNPIRDTGGPNQNPLNQPVRFTGPSQRTARRTAVIGAGGLGGLAAALGSDVLRGRQQ